MTFQCSSKRFYKLCKQFRIQCKSISSCHDSNRARYQLAKTFLTVSLQSWCAFRGKSLAFHNTSPIHFELGLKSLVGQSSLKNFSLRLTNWKFLGNLSCPKFHWVPFMVSKDEKSIYQNGFHESWVTKNEENWLLHSLDLTRSWVGWWLLSPQQSIKI